MPSWIGPWEIMLSIGCLVAAIFYLITLQQALARCSPQNRKMAPGLVWVANLTYRRYAHRLHKFYTCDWCVGHDPVSEAA